MKVFKYITIVFLLGVSSLAFAQNTPSADKLVSSIVIFNGEERVNASTIDMWAPLGNFSLPQTLLVSGGGSGDYKWRLKVVYGKDSDDSEVALQARILLNSVQSPTFTLSWDKGKSGKRQAYTNWLKPDTLGVGASSRFPVYVKLLESNSNGLGSAVTLEKVELEVWEEGFVESQSDMLGAKTMQAQAPKIAPFAEKQGSVNQNDMESKKMVAVKQLGIAFLKAASMGDKDEMKKLMSDDLVSLSKLNSMDKNRVNTLKVAGNKTFNDYITNYEPEVLSYAEFKDLFFDWDSRYINSWKVSEKSYIFAGNNLKDGGMDVFAGQNLVFIVEEENGEMKVKAFP